MIDAVLLFGLLNVLFEFTLLSMMPARMRLRVLGSKTKQRALHMGFLAANLAIHWGTIVGTMSGVFAFVCSVVTVKLARMWFGYIDGDTYRRGILAYKASELQ